MPVVYSDEEVFGSAIPKIAPSAPAEAGALMSDAEVFGTQEQMSEEDVFGKPPGALPTPLTMAKALGQGYGGQVGTSVAGLPTVLEMFRGGGAGGFQQQMREEQLGEEGLATEARARAVSTPQFQKAGKEIAEGIQKALPIPKEQEGLTTEIMRGFGSFGANVGTGILTGPIGAGLSALAGGAGEAQQTAQQKGQPQEMQDRVAYWGTIPGATDLVDYFIASGGTPGKLMGLIGKVGERIVKGMFAEALQEGTQQTGQNLIAKVNYDPTIPLMQDVPKSMLIGAIVGGGASAVLGGGHGAPTEPLPTQEAALRGLSGEVQAPAAAPTGAPTVQPPPPGPSSEQLELLLGGTAAEPQLPLGTPATVEHTAGLTPAPIEPQVLLGAPEAPIAIENNPQTIELRSDPITSAPLGWEVIPPQVLSPLEVPGVAQALDIHLAQGPTRLVTEHSSTLAGVLPGVSTEHLEGNQISERILTRLKSSLLNLSPNTPVHVLNDQEMRRAGYDDDVEGVYTFAPGSATLPPLSGPIFIRSSVLRDRERGSHILLHEATHAVTSIAMVNDPVVAEQVRVLMDQAELHFPRTEGMPKPYGFTNEREFVAEAFSNSAFQDYLFSQKTPRALAEKFGLQGRPTLWQSFVQMVRRILGMPDTSESVSLLESTIRTGFRIMEQQRQLLEKNQNALDRESGRGEVRAAPRHPSTQIVEKAVRQATSPGSQQTHAIAAAAAHADRINWVYKYMAGILELAKVNPRFAPLLRYVQKIQLMHREESTIQDAGVSINKEWRRLGAQSENVTHFLDEVTNMTYLTPQERAKGITRNPTPAEVQALSRRVGLDRRGAAFVGKIHKFFSNFLDLISENAREDARRLITDPVKLAQKLAEINTQVANLKSRPYFPFMRFGRYFVTVKDQAGKVIDFQLFERKGLVSAERRQQRFKAEMITQYGPGRVTEGVLPENSIPMVGMPRVLLERMKTELSLSPKQMDALEQLTFEMSPSLSFKHRFQHKNYTKGYSKDFARSFARYVFYGARFYSRTKYAALLREDIAAAGEVGGNKADKIRNYMQDHLDNTILDAKGDHGWLKGLAFLWHLGYSPAAATTNLTQTPMFTYPHLANEFNDAAAIASMIKAIAQVNKTFRKKGHYQNHTAFEMRAIGYGIKTGVISETQAAELAALGNHTNLLHGSAGNMAERAAIGFQQGAALMFEMTEQVNRRIAFRAALDLAQKYPKAKVVDEAVGRRAEEYNILTTVEGYTPAQARAIITALHIVEETQVVYGRYARPRLFRGRISGSVLIFERYMQAMIMQMVHNKGSAARTLLLMALLGGLGGLPGYEDLKDIIKAVYKRMGFGSNPELDLRKWIIEQFDGKVEPDIILHGLARRGFGIPAMLDALGSLWTGNPGRGFEMAKPGVNVPAPVLDFSKSVGMGQIFPVQIGKLMEPQEKTDKIISEQAQRAAGAGWSIFFNLYKAIEDQKLEWTDQKRWEKAMPRQMGALSKAYRAYEEGRERTRSSGASGASTVVNYDVRDTEQLMEVIAKGLGYNVTREAVKWDFVMAKKEAEEHTNMERNGLVEQFFEAWSGKDQKEIGAVRDSILKFNEGIKGTEFKGYQITSKSLEASVEQRQRQRIGQEATLPMQKRQGPLIQHFKELYPEAKGVIDVRRAP